MRLGGFCLMLIVCACAPGETPREVSFSSSWLAARDVRVDISEGPRRMTVEGRELSVDKDFGMTIKGGVSIEIAGDLPLRATADAVSLSRGGIQLEGKVETRLGEPVSP
jgi:hypothetical protein